MGFSALSRRLSIVFLVCALSAAAGPGRADTCSYTYDCRGSQQCAAMMGGMSGTRTASGTMTVMTVAGDTGSVRTVPVNKATCEQALRVIGLSYACTCTAGDAPTATASNGFQLKSTGSGTGDLVNDAAQLWILQNIKNPYTMTFAQNFTQSFLTTYVSNTKQREAAEAAIQQQQEEQARLAREAEQRRIDAIFARLNSELKLSGINSQLALKMGGDTSQLQMKLSDSGSGSLAFKLGGTPPAPGVNVGGPANAPAPGAPDGDTGGLRLKLGDTPSTGSDTPPAGCGIPGLPGIYLCGPSPNAANGGTGGGVPPEQAPQVAVAAISMSGPERDIAEDAALQAAQKNPALTAPSDDPFVQDYQQQAREYAQALKEQQAALDKAAEAQGHVQADQAALNYASGIAPAPDAAEPQSQAMARLESVEGTEEDLAAAASAEFDAVAYGTTVKREQAAISLAALAPPPPDLGASTSSAGSVASASATPRPAPPPVVHTSLPSIGASARPAILATPAPGGKPYYETVQACLARFAPSSHPNPTLEELKHQLDMNEQAYERLARTVEEQHELKAEWLSDMRKSVQDVAWKSVDYGADEMLKSSKEAAATVEADLAPKIAENVKQIQEFRAEMVKDSQALQVAGADPQMMAQLRARLAELKTQAQPLIARRTALLTEKANLEGADRTLREFKETRDFINYVTDMDGPAKFGESNPISKSDNLEIPTSLEGVKKTFLAQNGDINPTFDGVKQILMMGVTLAWDGTPMGATINAANLTIDLGYDLTVGYFGYQQLQQMSQNDVKFKQAKAALGDRMERLNAEMSCYSQAGAGANPEAAR